MIKKTPNTGAEGVLLKMKGKLTIRNERSSLLSYNLFNSFPLPSISKRRSRYEADYTLSVVSFISSSLRCIKFPKLRLFNDKTSSEIDIKGSEKHMLTIVYDHYEKYIKTCL